MLLFVPQYPRIIRNFCDRVVEILRGPLEGDEEQEEEEEEGRKLLALESIAAVCLPRALPCQRCIRTLEEHPEHAGCAFDAARKCLHCRLGLFFFYFVLQHVIHSKPKGTYTGSHKEPDIFLRPDTTALPRLIIETGWTDSWTHLQSDMHLWFSSTSFNM
jgi:hypothetical protein